jgi:excisionase family DNA binding protein
MRLLTPENVAEALAVSRSTVLRMIADGALPAVCLRVGRRKKIFRVRAEALERWVLAREKRGKEKGRAAATTPVEAPRYDGEDSGALAIQASASGEIA